MGLSPPYTTQGTFPALRRALVDDFPTISLLDPLIVIDFIIIYFIKNEFIKIGADAFRNIPFEEFYDLQIDPYETKNLIDNLKITIGKLEEKVIDIKNYNLNKNF